MLMLKSTHERLLTETKTHLAGVFQAQIRHYEARQEKLAEEATNLRQINLGLQNEIQVLNGRLMAAKHHGG